MEFVLRPGMRLMRRLGVAGKFGLIAVLLLVPMVTSMAASYRESTGQISFAARERQGLHYAGPLVELVIELAQTRTLANHGQPPGDGWLHLVRELDDATASYGDRLGVRADWIRLRADVQDVYRTPRPSAELAVRADAVAREARQVLKKVADSANLVLDPQLDSHYLMSMLVDRLPRLVLAAADAQAVRAAGETGTLDSLALQVAAQDFADAARRLSLDLTTAVTATSWRGLREQVGTEAWALSTAVSRYSAALSASADGDAPRPSSVDTMNLTSSSSALTGVLVNAADQLLVLRQDELSADRSRPLIFTLGMMAVVFYLLTALFRATTRDVRTVLEDISTVTTGGVHQTLALGGSDEFSQMSRAVVYARDQLTALVGALKYQATHDDLTALANRALFTEKTQEALTGATGQPSTIAVLLIDLDGFKDVNDSFGHELGDRLLRTVGARLHRCVPRRSVVARLAADEFAVLVTDSRQTQAPHELLGRVEEALSQPVDIDGRRMRVQAGIGVALARTASPGTAPEVGAVELLRNADVALSYAKARGKGHTAFFEPRMHDSTRERTELSADLVGAIDRDELRVLYQPLVDLQNGTLYGVEALLRWDHPTRGPISPAVFVPLAEATGQITSIGRWVLQQACRQLAEWQRDFPDGYPLTVEVNLATEQLADPHLVSDVLATIQSTEVDPKALVLEITESSLVRDVDLALTRLRQLAALGVEIALDDFGTGYSSLSYLRRLPVGILKIDKSFVLDESEPGRALLASVVSLGAAQGLQMIAEGIETIAQAERLRDNGCHLGQGHLWAPALDAGHITEIMRRGGRMAASGTASTALVGQRVGQAALQLPRRPPPRLPRQRGE